MGPDGSPSEDDLQNDDNSNSNDIEFEAESIIGCRLICTSRNRPAKQTIAQQLDISVDPNDFEFLIKWKGYPLHDATWEPYNNLKNSPILLNDYITAKCLPDHWRLSIPDEANKELDQDQHAD